MRAADSWSASAGWRRLRPAHIVRARTPRAAGIGLRTCKVKSRHRLKDHEGLITLAHDTALFIRFKPQRDADGFGQATQVRLKQQGILCFTFAFGITPFVKPLPPIVVLEPQRSEEH